VQRIKGFIEVKQVGKGLGRRLLVKLSIFLTKRVVLYKVS
jgi:hypothetical protein